MKEIPQPPQLFEDTSPIPSVEPFQPILEGLDTPEVQEVIVENCIVSSPPEYHRGKSGESWHCSLIAPPDLFNQDREEIVEASTQTNADIARRLHLKPGDRVSLRGYVQHSTLELGSGKTREIKRMSVSGIEVIHRDKRVSMTRHEMDKLL